MPSILEAVDFNWSAARCASRITISNVAHPRVLEAPEDWFHAARANWPRYAADHGGQGHALLTMGRQAGTVAVKCELIKGVSRVMIGPAYEIQKLYSMKNTINMNNTAEMPVLIGGLSQAIDSENQFFRFLFLWHMDNC